MEEENSRLEIAVQRMTQSAEGSSEKMEVGQRRESTEVRKATAKTCWPTEAGLNNARRCQYCLWLCESFAQNRRLWLSTNARRAAQCHIDFPLLALGADSSPCLFVCSFSSTLSVVFCVYVMKCVMPLVGNHRMNHWPWVVWFKEAKIVGVGRPGVLSQMIKIYQLDLVQERGCN